jgi:hypothetical protein
LADKDRRKYIRIKTSRAAECYISGRRFEGIIKDESTGGAYIQIKGAFSKGQDIMLIYTSPQGIVMKKSGKIARIGSDGIGIEFKYPGYSR